MSLGMDAFCITSYCSQHAASASNDRANGLLQNAMSRAMLDMLLATGGHAVLTGHDMPYAEACC